jgi:hypothetical protein
MVPPTPTPTTRLLKAAQAEREQLARHRRELLQARESLRVELDRIEGSLEEVTERVTLLDRLTGPAQPDASTNDGEGLAGRSADDKVTDQDDSLRVLRGPEIRREAVRVLLAHPDRPEALHYREWFGLLEAAGFSVAGKDPVATFLTQISRSPAVRKGTQSGVYEVDRAAARRLRRRLEELHGELRALAATPGQGVEVSVLRTRRGELNAELGRVEKALEEVELVFAAAGPNASHVPA